MSAVTLHLREPATSAACAVCGTSLTRGHSVWWLRNTWTSEPGADDEDGPPDGFSGAPSN